MYQQQMPSHIQDAMDRDRSKRRPNFPTRVLVFEDENDPPIRDMKVNVGNVAKQRMLIKTIIWAATNNKIVRITGDKRNVVKTY